MTRKYPESITQPNVDEFVPKIQDIHLKIVSQKDKDRAGVPSISSPVSSVDLMTDAPFLNPEHNRFQNHLTFINIHPAGNPRANLESISHRCYLREVAFEWELT